MSTTELPLGLIGPEDPDHPDHQGRTSGKGSDTPDKPDKDRKSIVLIVSAPNDPDPKHFRFDVDTLVGVAAKASAEKFDYDPNGNPSFRFADGTVLDRNITLKAAGLKHKDEVELVDAGGGV